MPPVSLAKRSRIVQLRTENPKLSAVAIGIRLGVSSLLTRKIIRDAAAVEMARAKGGVILSKEEVEQLLAKLRAGAELQ